MEINYMEQFYLQKVDQSRKQEIIEYIKECYKYKSRLNGIGRLQDYILEEGTQTLEEESQMFDKWFEKIKNEENAPLHKTCFLLIRKNDNKIIGMSNIRIQQDLGDYSFGHVGYGIRPTERGNGYGNIQFYLDLLILQANNIKTCIMACNKDNEISRKIIYHEFEGKLDKIIDDEEFYLIDVATALESKKEKFYKNVSN